MSRLFLLSLISLLLLGSGSGLGQDLVVDPHISMPTDQQFTLDIRIENGGQPVMGIEASIAFDPFLVQLDSIVPGPWFTDSGEDYFFWDYTAPGTGSIHFASSLLDAESTEDGVVAICHFSVLAYGQSPLIFQDVDVRDRLNVDLGFGHSSGDLIILDPAVPVERTSLGSVKSLFLDRR